MSKEDSLVDQHVTYTLVYQGRFYIVENVPARVNPETGEQFFAPSTVEHLQNTILSKRRPQRTVKTPVYNYGD